MKRRRDKLPSEISGCQQKLGFILRLGDRFLVSPPVQKSYYQAKQRGVKKECHPRLRRAKILAERLAFSPKQKKTDDLHNDGKGPAGYQDAVKK